MLALSFLAIASAIQLDVQEQSDGLSVDWPDSPEYGAPFLIRVGQEDKTIYQDLVNGKPYSIPLPAIDVCTKPRHCQIEWFPTQLLGSQNFDTFRSVDLSRPITLILPKRAPPNGADIMFFAGYETIDQEKHPKVVWVKSIKAMEWGATIEVTLPPIEICWRCYFYYVERWNPEKPNLSIQQAYISRQLGVPFDDRRLKFLSYGIDKPGEEKWGKLAQYEVIQDGFRFTWESEIDSNAETVLFCDQGFVSSATVWSKKELLITGQDLEGVHGRARCRIVGKGITEWYYILPGVWNNSRAIADRWNIDLV